VERIGFLSFGQWTPTPYSEVRTTSDAFCSQSNWQ